MQVHLANYEPDRVGGGWTVACYLVQHFGQATYDEADIYFITSASMIQRDKVMQAKSEGKKIVLRIDNAIRNSRNRNTGMTRMKDFCEVADLVIYQSEWAKSFLMPYTKKDGVVILNGVDTERFKNEGGHEEGRYLYVRSSRDEGKNWLAAWYRFVEENNFDPTCHLDIVGRFSQENLEYNFDFFNNESYTFMGEQKNMANIYARSKYFLYTYLNDACSNTLLEARASGCEIMDVYGMLQTGGAPEIMRCKDISLKRMLTEYEEGLSELL